jgi:hypothetical protein
LSMKACGESHLTADEIASEQESIRKLPEWVGLMGDDHFGAAVVDSGVELTSEVVRSVRSQ